MTTHLLMAGAAATWLLACLWFYRRMRGIPWLAGPTVTGALAMTGLTAIAATQVGDGWALAPVLLTNAVASALHLLAARRALWMEDRSLTAFDRHLSALSAAPARQMPRSI